MKLEKAILIQQELPVGGQQISLEDRLDATQLAIEALKRVKRSKPYGYAHPRDLLPGETEE